MPTESSGRKKRNDPDASPAKEETDDQFTERRFVALETGMNTIGEHISNIATRQSDTDVKLDKVDLNVNAEAQGHFAIWTVSLY